MRQRSRILAAASSQLRSPRRHPRRRRRRLPQQVPSLDPSRPAVRAPRSRGGRRVRFTCPAGERDDDRDLCLILPVRLGKWTVFTTDNETGYLGQRKGRRGNGSGGETRPQGSGTSSTVLNNAVGNYRTC